MNHPKNNRTKNYNGDMHGKWCIPTEVVNEIDSSIESINNNWLLFHRFGVRMLNNNRISADPHCFRADFRDIPFQELIMRQKKALANMGYEILWFRLKLDWHLTIGLGHESVYETSITLHPLYGYPYLPAQAIKGVCLSYIVLKYFEGDEKEALNCPDVQAMFGDEQQQGAIIFTNAIPEKAPNMKKDIMNVHYKTYYQGNGEPVDSDSPSLVTFPVVSDSSFQFGLSFKEDFNLTSGKFNEQSVKEAWKKWIPEVFAEHGIGAKTAVNYGYGKIDLCWQK